MRYSCSGRSGGWEEFLDGSTDEVAVEAGAGEVVVEALRGTGTVVAGAEPPAPAFSGAEDAVVWGFVCFLEGACQCGVCGGFGDAVSSEFGEDDVLAFGSGGCQVVAGEEEGEGFVVQVPEVLEPLDDGLGGLGVVAVAAESGTDLCDGAGAEGEEVEGVVEGALEGVVRFAVVRIGAVGIGHCSGDLRR